jgi:hypothetical protein
MFDIDSFDKNIAGVILEKDGKQKNIEFKIYDLTLEQALILYSKVGASIQNGLSNLFSLEEKSVDNLQGKISSLKSKKVSNSEIAKLLNQDETLSSSQNEWLEILFKIALEIIKNEELTKFLTRDLIINNVHIKLGDGNFIKIDSSIHNFNSPEYRKFLLPLWIRIVVKELKVFLGGLQSM